MKKKDIYLLFILYFLFGICVNIVHPITVPYVTTLQLEDFYFGLFASLMSLGQVIGAFVFGFLSDKIGRKNLIFIGLIGYSLCQLGFGFLNFNPILILIFRFLAGVFVSAPSTLFVSMCLDFSNEENKVKNLTIHSSCYILGTSLGYEIGGLLYDYAKFSIDQIFIFQIIFTLISSILFMIFIKDRFKIKVATENIKHIDIKINPLIYLLLVPLFVLTISQILINRYLDPFVIHKGYKPSILGHYILITGLISVISNILIIPLIKKIKNKKLGIFLISFILISSLLTFFTFLSEINIIILLFTSHLLYIVLKGFITPLEQNELSTYSDEFNKGKLTGLRQMIISLGNVIGPLIGSLIYSKGSPLIFIIASFITLLSFVLYIIYFIIKKII